KYVRGSGVPHPEALQKEVDALLAEIDRQVSTYRSDSLIEAFNNGPAGCQAMPAPVLELARYGLELSHRSEGAFDLTLEPLLNLWGFGPKSRGQRVPDTAEIDAAREQYGYRLLEVRDGQLCKARDAVQVDFNSIAAGQAVDRIAQLLQAQGANSYLVE